MHKQNENLNKEEKQSPPNSKQTRKPRTEKYNDGTKELNGKCQKQT